MDAASTSSPNQTAGDAHQPNIVSLENMKPSNRPLSPHLQVYRPQLTSVLSITHRGTGVFLAVATLLLVYWLAALTGGEQSYLRAQVFFGSWFGQLVLLACTFSLFYHLCNGVRHLFWDIGVGFELEAAYRSGYAVVAVSMGMTVLAWSIALASGS